MPSAGARKNLVRTLLVLGAILVYVTAHARFFLYAVPHAAADILPSYGTLPDFKLVRQDGASFGSDQMRGKLWVADFMFTRCPNQCPMMSLKFGALQKELPDDVRLVSFSVDPVNDTPERLRDYGRTYGAEEKRWTFLTGDPAVLRGILDAAHVGNSGDPNLHSLRFVLLDKTLGVRGYYDSTDAGSLDKMKKDIRQLGKEK